MSADYLTESELDALCIPISYPGDPRHALAELENEQREHLLRWLQAHRDYPGLDVGPEPTCIFRDIREQTIREFNRTA